MASNSDALDTLTRSDNTRDAGWNEAFSAAAQSPWFGVGYQQNIIEIAGTPLRALDNGGIVGVVFIAILYAGVILAGRNCGLPVQIFSVAAIANSFFEGWFLSLVSPLLFIFAAGWWSLAVSRPRKPRSKVDRGRVAMNRHNYA